MRQRNYAVFIALVVFVLKTNADIPTVVIDSGVALPIQAPAAFLKANGYQKIVEEKPPAVFYILSENTQSKIMELAIYRQIVKGSKDTNNGKWTYMLYCVGLTNCKAISKFCKINNLSMGEDYSGWKIGQVWIRKSDAQRMELLRHLSKKIFLKISKKKNILFFDIQ